MSKVTLNSLANLQNETTAVNLINSNSTTVQTAFDNTLSRDGTSPNTMSASLDMNSNRILNLPTPLMSAEPLRLIDLANFTAGGTVSVQYLPTGGTTGQVLKKNSNSNYDVTWSANSIIGRTVLTGNTTYYVNNVTGNDSNTGLSSGAAFATITHAVQNVMANVDLAGFNLIIQLVTTGVVYNETIGLGPYVGRSSQGHTGGAPVTIQGDPGGNAALVTISPNAGSGANAIFTAVETGGFEWILKNMTLTSADIGLIYSDVNAWVVLDNVITGAAPLANKLAASGGVVEIVNNYTDTGNAFAHAIVANGGKYLFSGTRVVTISGIPTYSVAYLNIASAGQVVASNNTFSGAFTGKKWIGDASTFAFGPNINLDVLFTGSGGGATAGSWTPALQVYQGGTGANLFNTNGILYGAGVSSILSTGVNATANRFYLAQVSSGTPAFVQIPSSDLGGFGAVGHVIRSTGAAYADAALAASDLSNGVTGSGLVVLQTSPSLITPALGVATATSINALTITAPVTAATLTIANNKTLTASNTLTLAGTDATTITFQGTDTYIGRATTDTFTNKTYDTSGTGNVFRISGTQLTTVSGTGSVVLATSPTLTTPVLGVATGTQITLTSANNFNAMTLASGAAGSYVGLALQRTAGTNEGYYLINGANDQFIIGNVAGDFNIFAKNNLWFATNNDGARGIKIDTSQNMSLPGSMTSASKSAITAGGVAGAGLLVSSTANFGVFFGSSAPTISAAKGSLYLRSDGSSTSTRAYINTDGSTTWTAITTAA